VQAVQHWLNQGSWDADRLMVRYRGLMMDNFGSLDGHFIFDDTSFEKSGDHSVGVQPQYCGCVGKTANCQVAVSLHYSSPTGHFPLAMRLYLPETWIDSPKKLIKARVPVEYRKAKTKPEIAIELLDVMLQEGHPGSVALADAGYGCSSEFRAALAARDMTYAVGVKGESNVFTAAPRWNYPGDPGMAPNCRNPRLHPESPQPCAIKKAAAGLKFRAYTWRENAKGKMTARFARMRVWPAENWREGECAATPPVWLIVEERGSELRYTMSNASEEASLLQLVRLLKSRWPVEQGYQQLKEELGLDHFEGRSWIGFHHHACMTMLAYGFLEIERDSLRKATNRPLIPHGSKKSPVAPAPNTSIDS
jgi:SRSO17 transposase